MLIHNFSLLWCRRLSLSLPSYYAFADTAAVAAAVSVASELVAWHFSV